MIVKMGLDRIRGIIDIGPLRPASGVALPTSRDAIRPPMQDARSPSASTRFINRRICRALNSAISAACFWLIFFFKA